MFNNGNELLFDAASDVIFSPWEVPGGGIAEELNDISEDNGSIEIRLPSEGLGDVGGTIYIWGHGNYSPIIAGGDKQVLSSRNLARLLVSSGLRQNYAGNIVIWSCWGGQPGGIASELMIQMRNRKYNNVRIWGARYVTGIMRWKKFYITPNVQLDAEGVMNNQVDPNNRRFATRDDMIGYPRN